MLDISTFICHTDVNLECSLILISESKKKNSRIFSFLLYGPRIQKYINIQEINDRHIHFLPLNLFTAFLFIVLIPSSIYMPHDSGRIMSAFVKISQNSFSLIEDGLDYYRKTPFAISKALVRKAGKAYLSSNSLALPIDWKKDIELKILPAKNLLQCAKRQKIINVPKIEASVPSVLLIESKNLEYSLDYLKGKNVLILRHPSVKKQISTSGLNIIKGFARSVEILHDSIEKELEVLLCRNNQVVTIIVGDSYWLFQNIKRFRHMNLRYTGDIRQYSSLAQTLILTMIR